MEEAKSAKIEFVTGRLIIRTPEEKDAHDIFVLMSDREIAASTGFRPMNTLSEAEGKIRRGEGWLSSSVHALLHDIKYIIHGIINSII